MNSPRVIFPMHKHVFISIFWPLPQILQCQDGLNRMHSILLVFNLLRRGLLLIILG